MLSFVTVFLALSAGMYAPVEAPAVRAPIGGVELRYHRPLGQVAHYLLSLDVQGAQVSLGETLPVRWKADIELSEEVIAKGADGSLWLRMKARPVGLSNANGAFAGGMTREWPEVRLHLSSRGELLEIARDEAKGEPGARERALTALMAEVTPVILPAAPVQPGEEWQVAANGARQTNRLLSIKATDGQEIARIACVSTSPLSFDETIQELGLETHLTGEARQTSDLELLVSSGLTRRHRGRAHIVTKSQTSLSSLPASGGTEGSQTFSMESDLTVSFDLRLKSTDGQPVGAR